MKKIKIFAQEGEFEVTEERSDSVSYKGGGGYQRSLSMADRGATWDYAEDYHHPALAVPNPDEKVSVTDPSLDDLINADLEGDEKYDEQGELIEAEGDPISETDETPIENEYFPDEMPNEEV